MAVDQVVIGLGMLVAVGTAAFAWKKLRSSTKKDVVYYRGRCNQCLKGSMMLTPDGFRCTMCPNMLSL